ncbi:glutathione S-transferase family protein [Limibacillus halophilus]
MYKVYGRMDTGSFAVEAVLAELEQPFERVLVPRERPISEQLEFLAVNPRGQVPAVVTPQGEVLTESAAILITLAERHPEGGLLPPPQSPERAQVLRWLIFAAVNLYESDLRYYYADRYTGDQEGAAGVRAAAAAYFERQAALIESRVDERGPYLLGERFSLIDPYLAMLLSWHWQPEAFLPSVPKLARLMGAVAARPKIAPLWDEHRGRAA